MKNFLPFLCFAASAIISVQSQHVIESPPVTNMGIWFYWDSCPPGEFANGMQLNFQEQLGPASDNTALNGIRFYCGKLGESSTRYSIKSGMESKGIWGGDKFCPSGKITGFQLRAVPFKGAIFDDVAANNLRIFCDSSKDSFVEGDGPNANDQIWTEEQHCEDGYAVCAISTQIEVAYGRADETALNNVRMRCCNLSAYMSV